MEINSISEQQKENRLSDLEDNYLGYNSFNNDSLDELSS